MYDVMCDAVVEIPSTHELRDRAAPSAREQEPRHAALGEHRASQGDEPDAPTLAVGGDALGVRDEPPLRCMAARKVTGEETAVPAEARLSRRGGPAELARIRVAQGKLGDCASRGGASLRKCSLPLAGDGLSAS